LRGVTTENFERIAKKPGIFALVHAKARIVFLNVVYLAEYSIWNVLREKVYHSKIAAVDELKRRLIDE